MLRDTKGVSGVWLPASGDCPSKHFFGGSPTSEFTLDGRSALEVAATLLLEWLHISHSGCNGADRTRVSTWTYARGHSGSWTSLLSFDEGTLDHCQHFCPAAVYG